MRGATVVVPRAALAAGDLPAICAKSGTRTDRVLPVALRSVPRHLYWLLPVGVVPFLVVRAVVARRVPARLPLSGAAFGRLVALTYAGWTTFGAGLATLVVAAGLAPPRAVSAAAAAAVLVGAAVVVLADLVGLAGVRETDDPDHVLLTRVHPAFADALAPR